MWQIFVENANAVLKLPTEVKMIIVIALAAMLVISLIKKIAGLTKLAVIGLIAYIVITYTGLI